MIVVAVILTVIIAPILWLVFVPVNIRVDTARGLYEVSQLGTFTARLCPGDGPVLNVKVFGFLIDVQGKRKSKTSGKTKSPVRHAKKMKSFRAVLELVRGMMTSFRCKRFVCEIDFGDVVLNAQLLPVGYLVSHGPVVVNVNFENKNLLDIWIKARVHRMVWTFMRFYLTK